MTVPELQYLSKLQHFSHKMHMAIYVGKLIKKQHISWDSREIFIGRRVCKRESQVRKIPVIGIVNVDVANWHVIKQSVVSVDNYVLGACLWRVVVRALNHESEMPCGPLLWHAIITDVHAQTIRLEAEGRPLEITTFCNQASLISWPQKTQRATTLPQVLQLPSVFKFRVPTDNFHGTNKVSFGHR